MNINISKYTMQYPMQPVDSNKLLHDSIDTELEQTNYLQMQVFYCPCIIVLLFMGVMSVVFIILVVKYN